MTPRTVADATRFTPSGPHAFTASATPSTPGGETPQQRVARLRDAARKAKAERAAGTTFDRIVDRGRVWADRAHRITAVGLIGATFLCAGVTIYAFTDMVIYTRRRKAEYFAALKEQQLLEPAAAAAVPATATATAAAATSQRLPEISAGGAWKRIKSWGMSGLTPADQEYKTAFEKAREEELREAEKVVAPVVVGATLEGKDGGHAVDRLGADDLVKGEKAKGGSTGVLSSITGWWSGR